MAKNPFGGSVDTSQAGAKAKGTAPDPFTYRWDPTKNKGKGAWVYNPAGAGLGGGMELGPALGKAIISGSGELLFGPGTPGDFGQAIRGVNTALTHADMSADQLIYEFQHMSGADPNVATSLGHLQAQLYQAGFYPGTSKPNYGHVNDQDITAFRQFLIGVAVNPSAAKVGDVLQQAADYGTATGINRTGAPKVVKLTNPDDIRMAADTAAQQLFGGKLSEDEMTKFIASYQGLQTAETTANYNAGDPALTGSYAGVGGAVVQAPSLETAAKNAVLQDHPNQVFVSALGQQLKALGPQITSPGGGFL